MSSPLDNGPHHKPPPPCPRCGSGAVRRLIYGLIGYELFLELGDGEPDFELGWLKEPQFEWRCARCGHEWRGTG